MRKYVAHHAGLNNGVRIKLMNPSMIASKYELLIAQHEKTIDELRRTMSDNNEFYHDQLVKIKKLNADLRLNKSRRVS